jgi:multidrug transporter EmrE-like cation transporter
MKQTNNFLYNIKNMWPIVIILLAVVTTSMTLFLLKKYISTKEIKWLYIWSFCLIIGVVTNVKLLSMYDLSYIYPILKIINILVVMGVGIFFLGEKVNIYGYVGVLFAILSLYLLNYAKE